MRAGRGICRQHRGSSLVIAGESQPAAVHALAHAMNAALGNAGKTVIYTDPIEASPENDSLRGTGEGDRCRAGGHAVDSGGGNPVYTRPRIWISAQQFLKVPIAHSSGPVRRRNGVNCAIGTFPQAHYLESWSDARAYDGTVGIIQPLIAPLYRRPIAARSDCCCLTGDSGKSGHESFANTGRRSDPKDRTAVRESSGKRRCTTE